MIKKIASILFFAYCQLVLSQSFAVMPPRPSVLIFQEAQKKGLKSIEGTILLNAEYDEVWQVSENLYKITKSGRENVFYKNRIVAEKDFESVNFATNDTFVAKDKNDNCIYILDNDDQYKLAMKTKDQYVVNNGFTLVLADASGKKTIHFKNGKFLPDKYSYMNIYDNVIVTSINRKWGLIKDGIEIAPFMYDSIDTIGYKYKQRSEQGYMIRYKTAKFFIVSLNKKYGIIDVNGKTIFPVNYDNISLDERTNVYTLVLDGKAENFDVVTNIELNSL